MTTKTIVLTGATRGLGLAMATEFARQGHRVFGCGRDEEQIRYLNAHSGEGVEYTRVDVTSMWEVDMWADDVCEKVKAPDLLINNAGVMNRPATLWNISADDFQRVIDINVCGVANVLRAFVPEMIIRGRGTIVNFSSGWGRSTSPEVAPYCASKFAVEGLTQALAQELPPGMAAVPLNPGVIDTDMLRTCWSEIASNYPSPENWATVAVPFILGLSDQHSGQPLTVPGF